MNLTLPIDVKDDSEVVVLYEWDWTMIPLGVFDNMSRAVEGLNKHYGWKSTHHAVIEMHYGAVLGFHGNTIVKASRVRVFARVVPRNTVVGW